jgi:FHA domain
VGGINSDSQAISSDMLSGQMNPRLVAISGHLKGTTFALTEDEIMIGRETSNTICLNELSVSRRHCRIIRESSELQDRAGKVPSAGVLNKENNHPRATPFSSKSSISKASMARSLTVFL